MALQAMDKGYAGGAPKELYLMAQGTWSESGVVHKADEIIEVYSSRKIFFDNSTLDAGKKIIMNSPCVHLKNSSCLVAPLIEFNMRLKELILEKCVLEFSEMLVIKKGTMIISDSTVKSATLCIEKGTVVFVGSDIMQLQLGTEEYPFQGKAEWDEKTTIHRLVSFIKQAGVQTGPIARRDKINIHDHNTI
jgi:hypothetical protein